jgi:hypothetical protein
MLTHRNERAVPERGSTGFPKSSPTDHTFDKLIEPGQPLGGEETPGADPETLDPTLRARHGIAKMTRALAVGQATSWVS